MALAHMDGQGIDEAVTNMVARVQELAIGYPEGRIELQLIGGFRDNNNFSEDIFCSVMRKYKPPTTYIKHFAAIQLSINLSSRIVS